MSKLFLTQTWSCVPFSSNAGSSNEKWPKAKLFANFWSHKLIPGKLLSKPLAEWISLCHVSLLVPNMQHTLPGGLSQSRCLKQRDKYPDYSPGVNGASSLMLGSQSAPRPCHLFVWIPVWCSDTTHSISHTLNMYWYAYVFRPLSHSIRTKPLWKLLLATVSRLWVLGHNDCAVTKTSADFVNRRWWDARSCTASKQADSDTCEKQ